MPGLQEVQIPGETLVECMQRAVQRDILHQSRLVTSIMVLIFSDFYGEGILLLRDLRTPGWMQMLVSVLSGF